MDGCVETNFFGWETMIHAAWVQLAGRSTDIGLQTAKACITA